MINLQTSFILISSIKMRYLCIAFCCGVWIVSGGAREIKFDKNLKKSLNVRSRLSLSC